MLYDMNEKIIELRPFRRRDVRCGGLAGRGVMEVPAPGVFEKVCLLSLLPADTFCLSPSFPVAHDIFSSLDDPHHSFILHSLCPVPLSAILFAFKSVSARCYT